MFILFQLAGLVSLVCWIMILIHAFTKSGALQGILCLCCSPYAVVYGFIKFEHEKKNLIMGAWIVAIIIQIAAIATGAFVLPKFNR